MALSCWRTALCAGVTNERFNSSTSNLGNRDRTALIEHFIRTYREEVPNAYGLETLDQVCEVSAQWLQSYNEERPHQALAGIPPATYRTRCLPLEILLRTCLHGGEAYSVLG